MFQLFKIDYSYSTVRHEFPNNCQSSHQRIELKNNAVIHKDNSLNRLDLSFLKHIELSEYKKCDLLAYWINDFSEYHDEERTFNIAKSGMYSRGDVIKVNFI